MDTIILLQTKWWDSFNCELYVKYLETKIK